MHYAWPEKRPHGHTCQPLRTARNFYGILSFFRRYGRNPIYYGQKLVFKGLNQHLFPALRSRMRSNTMFTKWRLPVLMLKRWKWSTKSSNYGWISQLFHKITAFYIILRSWEVDFLSFVVDDSAKMGDSSDFVRWVFAKIAKSVDVFSAVFCYGLGLKITGKVEN